MTRVIRIDEEVYRWLQEQGRVFDDTPNSVLRRIARLDSNSPAKATAADASALTGKALNERWGVRAKHALYHKDGRWYETLKAFPGAMFDAHGYKVFNSEEEYKRSSGLRIGKKVNVRGGLNTLPGYVNVA